MAPKLKVYGITAFINAPLTPEMLGSAPHVRQAHAVVAAPSKKAAAEAFEVSMYELNRSGGETGNDEDIAVALSEPGTVFYRPMNGRGPSFRGDGTPAGSTTEKHLWENTHPYIGPELMYFADGYENERYVYESKSWADFLANGEFGPAATDDPDLNWLYRWDWNTDHDEDDGTVHSRLRLYFLLPRKGILSHTTVHNMTPADEPAVREYLTGWAEYMATMWSPFLTVKEA